MLYYTGRRHVFQTSLLFVWCFNSFFLQHDSRWHNFFQLPNEVKIGHLCHPAWQHNIQDCSLSTYLMPGCKNLACISLLRPSAIGYYCCFSISATREMLQWHDKYTRGATKGTTGWHVPITSHVGLIQQFPLTINFRCVQPFWWDYLTLYCDVVQYVPILDDLVRRVLGRLNQYWLKTVSQLPS